MTPTAAPHILARAHSAQTWEWGRCRAADSVCRDVLVVTFAPA